MKFFRSVIKTMKETRWPTKKEAVQDTTTVIMTSVFFAVFFAIVDYGVQAIIKLLV
ncbi:preprotein translocase subunit SecE [Liquorilactobacillus aquaticus]|uniref:preprotein translocase subunit SecE n=1 Tax=Liquorilactobacillus aquaticus TaxID=392566 RepID=UPI000708F1E4|nr:preprotein translocase subunit SecE [Liquorilactobacillus aquaticus]